MLWFNGFFVGQVMLRDFLAPGVKNESKSNLTPHMQSNLITYQELARACVACKPMRAHAGQCTHNESLPA